MVPSSSLTTPLELWPRQVAAELLQGFETQE